MFLIARTENILKIVLDIYQEMPYYIDIRGNQATDKMRGKKKMENWKEYQVTFGATCIVCKSKMFQGVKAFAHIHSGVACCSKECAVKSGI